ncbi:MAG: type II toxin-antitoxin system VapC family toxin [Gallionella sp.]|nr:type II toxin-antitoxin system VapC family toxin [Gallionella sp.]
MGLDRSLVYLDTCTVIYFVEEHPVFGIAVSQALAQLPTQQIGISPLVELECLVAPLRSKNAALLNRYKKFFEQCVCFEMPPEVYQRAAELRALHSLKTPDALHLATVQYHGCTAVWTNDNRLNNSAGSLAVNLLTNPTKNIA